MQKCATKKWHKKKVCIFEFVKKVSILILMPRQKSSKNPDSQNVYIGLDVHLRQWNVCIYQGGIARKPFQQSPSASVLLAHLKAHYPEMNYYSAYEAGVCGCSVHYELLAAGIENIIFNAADISQTHKERVRKTDAVDAAKIARSLAYGELRCIHIPPKWRLDDRNLLRLRSTLVSDMKRLKSRLRHYLHVNGITIPPEFQPRRWPLAFIKWLKKTAIDNNNTTGSTLAMMVDKIENAVTELKNIDKLLLAMMKEKRYKSDYQLLRSIPGVGAQPATTILLECGDLADFGTADAFCAFVGLIPDIYRSDEHDGKCGITRRHHRVLRYMFTECAWRSIRKDPYLSGLYAGYCRRMPTTKAIVKIANKLARITKFVLKNKKAYVQTE